MSFWDGFKANGDRFFTFLSLASTALQGLDHLPTWASQLILICGLLATAAHQSFFPSQAPGGAK